MVFFRGEEGQLFEVVFLPPPSSLRWQCPETPVVVANTLLHFMFFKVCGVLRGGSP